jgi:oligopeptide transport system substrate-binding protein
MRLFKYIPFFTIIIILSCETDHKKNTNQVSNQEITSNFLTIPLREKPQLKIWNCADTARRLALINQLYETLFIIDPLTKKAKPLLVRNYTIDASLTYYTFTLKSDIRFHDDASFNKGKGRLLTASDVVFCFEELLKNPIVTVDSTITPKAKLDSSYIKQLLVVKGVPFIKATVINSSQFSLQLLAPNPELLNLLCKPKFAIYAKELKTYYANENYQIAIGTGPFYLEKYSDKEILVYRNKRYHQNQEENQVPKLDAVRYIFVKNPQQEMDYFTEGKTDLYYDRNKDTLRYKIKNDVQEFSKQELQNWNFRKTYISTAKQIKPYN